MVAAVMPKRAAVSRSTIDVRRQSAVEIIRRDVLEIGRLLQRGHQVRHPLVQHGRARRLEDELVLRAADRGIDRQVLHRLQIERDARDRMPHRASAGARPSRCRRERLSFGFEIDQEAAAVERVVGAVDADERGEARRHRDPSGSRRPAHSGARPSRRTRRSGAACVMPWTRPVSCSGKKPFGMTM